MFPLERIKQIHIGMRNVITINAGLLLQVLFSLPFFFFFSFRHIIRVAWCLWIVKGVYQIWVLIRCKIQSKSGILVLSSHSDNISFFYNFCVSGEAFCFFWAGAVLDCTVWCSSSVVLVTGEMIPKYINGQSYMLNPPYYFSLLKSCSQELKF